MAESIFSQPSSLVRAIDSNIQQLITFATSLASTDGRTVHLVGTGTSLHAAELGAYFLREKHSERAVHAVPYSSYEFVNYTPALRRHDVVLVISHRGYKNYSNKSLRMGREAGCTVGAVTGHGSTIADRDADFIFRTVEQEKSSAHTVSLTSALGILLSLSIAVELPVDEARAQISSTARRVADRMEMALGSASALETFLSGLGEAGRIWIFGGGPNKIVAREGALKIQETSYLDAYGFEVEQMIHGPMRAASIEKDLFVPIIWGKNGARSSELARAIADAGGRILAVSDNTSDAPGCLPGGMDIAESLSPFVTLCPLQLMALHLALVRGTDPDGFRREEPHFAKIDARIKL